MTEDELRAIMVSAESEGLLKKTVTNGVKYWTMVKREVIPDGK